MRNIVKICFAVFLYAAITAPCIAQEVTAVPTTTTESSFHALDYVALFGYMGVVVVIGVYFSRRETTTDDYFLAGRRVPWWAATLGNLTIHSLEKRGT
jgi:hypothetical protein